MKKIFMSVLALAMCSVSSLFADNNLLNQSVEDMKTNYYGVDILPCQFGTTFSVKDETGTDAGYENIPLAQIYRLNMAVSVPSGYTEKTNGNFANPGSNQYAIVSDPSKLNSAFNAEEDDYNRLVMNNVASNAEILSIEIKNYDIEYAKDVMLKLNIDEVAHQSGAKGSAKFGIFIGDYKVDEVVVNAGDELVWLNDVSIDKTKLSSKFTLSIKRIDTDTNADDFVLAFSEVMMTGEAKVVSGISIAIKYDEGQTLGSSVSITAAAASSIPEQSIKWERKSAEGDWTELQTTGLDLVDTPLTPGTTYYRAKYYDDEEWKYSNQVSVSRVMGCATTSQVLWNEDFGTLDTENSRNSNQYVTSSYEYKASGNVNDGNYAVVANPRTAGTDGCSAESCYWFRDTYDHTQGTPAGGAYGGMLLVNCKSGKQSNDIVMERKLSLGCKNAFVNFSAWFANAGWERGTGGNNPIDMVIRVVAPNSEVLAEISVVAQKSEGWKNGIVSFYNKDWESEQLTLQIINNGVGGGGNDVLIDDIEFTICRPDVKLDALISGQSVENLEDIRTACGGDVLLIADPLDAYKSLYGVDTPYYKWLKSTDNVAWEDASHAGTGSSYKDFTVQASSTRTYYKCVIGPDKDAVDAYIQDPQAFACSSVAEASYASVRCPADVSVAVDKTGCNRYKLSFSSSPDPNSVDWYIGSDECGWKPLSGSTSVTRYYELTSEDIPTSGCKLYFKGVDANDETRWATSSVYVEYRELSLTSNLNTKQTVGCDLVYDLTAEMKKNGATATVDQYSFQKSNGNVIQATSSPKCQLKKADGYETGMYKVVSDHCDATAYVDMSCPQLNYTNVCNQYTFTLIGDDGSNLITWYYGNGQIWTKIDGESKSTLVIDDISTLFPESADRPFYVGASIERGSQGTKAAALDVPGITVPVDVYDLTLKAELVREYECKKTFTLKAELKMNYDEGDGEFTFYEKGKPEIICGPGSDTECGPTPEIDSNTTYYVTTDAGCYAEVSVEAGCLKLTHTNKCNVYTFNVEGSKGGTIKWEYGNGQIWKEIPGASGTTYTVDITTLFDASSPDLKVIKVSEGTLEADTYVTIFNLTLTATPSTIEQCGGEAILEAQMTMVGQIMPVYTFYKKGVDTPIQDASWDNTCPTGELYGKTTFVVESGSCTAETDVNVNLVWPTIFMPYTAGSTNQTFDVCAKSIKIFDRTGNMIADVDGNSWDGICTNGTAKGSYAMPDVYFYVATLEDGSTYKGTVEVYKETKTSK